MACSIAFGPSSLKTEALAFLSLQMARAGSP
jgi:hypothetical protein